MPWRVNSVGQYRSASAKPNKNYHWMPWRVSSVGQYRSASAKPNKNYHWMPWRVSSVGQYRSASAKPTFPHSSHETEWRTDGHSRIYCLWYRVFNAYEFPHEPQGNYSSSRASRSKSNTVIQTSTLPKHYVSLRKEPKLSFLLYI